MLALMIGFCSDLRTIIDNTDNDEQVFDLELGTHFSFNKMSHSVQKVAKIDERRTRVDASPSEETRGNLNIFSTTFIGDVPNSPWSLALGKRLTRIFDSLRLSTHKIRT